MIELIYTIFVLPLIHLYHKVGAVESMKSDVVQNQKEIRTVYKKLNHMDKKISKLCGMWEEHVRKKE